MVLVCGFVDFVSLVEKLLRRNVEAPTFASDHWTVLCKDIVRLVRLVSAENLGRTRNG